MIFQLFVPASYTLSKIPFESGIYDVKISRIDVAIGSTGQFFGIWMKSVRLPLKNAEFIEYFPAPSSFVNRCGLFLPIRNAEQYNNNTGTPSRVNTLDFVEEPLIFKDVYLDGYIDTEFFNMGTNSSAPGSLTSPPFALGAGSNRMLIHFDIIPKKIYNTII